MSLILDALSRAEREKREQASTAPNILSQELAAQEPAKDFRVLALLLGVVVLAAAVIALLYLVLRDPPAPMVSAIATPVMEATKKELDSRAVSDSRRASFETAGPQVPSMQESTADRKALPSLDRKESSQAVAALYTLSSNEAVAGSLQRSDASPVETVVSKEVSTETQPVVEDVIDVEQVLREMRARTSVDTLEPHAAPLLENLTKQFRDRVPTLMYSRHDYSTSGRSSVTINGETLNPAQRTRGVEVREILSDSVILRFEGADFRLKSLNSWVNL